MGFQRGAHVDGPQICSQYEYKIPGGNNPDGSALFGWNDVGAVFCLRCGHRDTEHTLVRDTIERSSRRTSTKVEAARPLAHKRAVSHAPMLSDVEQLSRAVASTMQLYELEPGVADPLAVLAYEDAKREHEKMRVRLAVDRAEGTRVPVATTLCTLLSCLQLLSTVRLRLHFQRRPQILCQIGGRTMTKRPKPRVFQMRMRGSRPRWTSSSSSLKWLHRRAQK